MLVSLEEAELSLLLDLLDMEMQESDEIIGHIADENEDVDEMLQEAGDMVDLKVDISRLRQKLQTYSTTRT